MSYATHWRCYKCLRIKERAEFNGISLKSLCRACRGDPAKPAGDTTASPQTVFVKAKRVLKTKRNHDRSEPM